MRREACDRDLRDELLRSDLRCERHQHWHLYGQALHQGCGWELQKCEQDLLNCELRWQLRCGEPRLR